MTKKVVYQILIFSFVFSFLQGLFLVRPKKLESANLTNASATLSNSRLSFFGKVGTGNTSPGDVTITIQSSGNADNNTNHLFPNDGVAVGVNGGLTVGSIIDSTSFALTSGLTVGVSEGDAVYATQSGSLTVQFDITNDIPANGDVIVTIPDPASGGNDGAPDTAASTSTNGFDLNGIAAGDITCSGGTGATWGTAVVTAGSGSGHTIVCPTTTAVTGGTITVTIDSDPGLVNPAPVTTGHTQGTADTYTINVKSRDASDSTIDEVDIKVAPVEAVLVSATVEETLSFTIAGIGVGTTVCNNAADITTTAYSVPWGSFSSTDTFYEGAQQLTVSTNADAGYAVKIEENDQMGKNGTTCTGASAGESVNCIQDTTCGATSCSESAAYDWTAASSYHGLGISLEDVSGTDAVWDYDGKAAESTCTSGTFCARQIADQEAGETKASIMTNTAPVSGSSAYVCYRIAISATQPAGYYYNKVKYTATATF